MASSPSDQDIAKEVILNIDFRMLTHAIQLACSQTTIWCGEKESGNAARYE